ncbi:translationally-controlled tumor protein homolog [Plectropomus leopardus]|uniref:translationally-controlled tumor protein homolog n=1 Tax=Plectropomus leopardus TaxID=160734 RepID=UPI001C4CFAB5|nr:translationally-controlled tumor protein homolog [Plectropomus leopardus]
MIVYKDIISGDEMFSDIYKISTSNDGLLYEVEGMFITRTDDIDERLIGANASAEEVTEGTETSSVSGINIVLNHKLQQTGFNAKSYKMYIKSYVKAVLSLLEQNNPERVEAFKRGVTPVVKKIVSNIDNYLFFTGESMNTEGMVVLLDYREDGTTPFMLFFKDGLLEEKC